MTSPSNEWFSPQAFNKRRLSHQTRDNNTLHTEPRAARLLETVIFAAAR